MVRERSDNISRPRRRPRLRHTHGGAPESKASAAHQLSNATGLGPAGAALCALGRGAFTLDGMGRCILALYRSAAQPKMAEWGAELAAAERRPGLVVIATEDHYTGGEAMARRSAERFGADVVVLPGLGHWWMLEDPAAGAAALRPFLDRVAAS